MTPVELCAWPVISFGFLYMSYAWFHELKEWYAKDDAP